MCSMGSQLPQKGPQSPPRFLVHVCCGQNGWMDEDTTRYGSRPRLMPQCIRRGPSSLRKGHSRPLLFGPCLLWPRLPISATAELLLRYASGQIDMQTNTNKHTQYGHVHRSTSHLCQGRSKNVSLWSLRLSPCCVIANACLLC